MLNTLRRHLRRREGFTLIEVLVGLGILGVLYMFGAAAVSGVSEGRAVVETARRLADDIRLVQQRALADGVAWKLTVRPSTGDYVFAAGNRCRERSVGDPIVWTESGKTGTAARGAVFRHPSDPDLRDDIEVVFDCTGKGASYEISVLVTNVYNFGRTVTVAPVTGVRVE